MLRVDLGRLGREGFVLLEARVPTDDPLWSESGIPWDGPVDVHLRVSYAGTGEVVVRGTVAGPLRRECRRCLKPVEGALDEEITIVLISSDEVGDEGDAQIFEPTGAELDLSKAVREELILAFDPYVVCEPDCKGFCPKCGTDLNEGTCTCTDDEPDPRWDVLRALKEK